MFNGLLRRWRQMRGASGAPAQPPVAPSVPGPAIDWIARGNTALGAGRLPEAVEAYARARQDDPTNPIAWLNHGFACLEQGDAEAALGDLRRCLALAGPDDTRLRADAQFLAGRAHAALGQREDAITAYRAALAAAPDFEEARVALSELRVDHARELHATGLSDEALALLDEVLAEDAMFVPALDGRGVVLLDTDRASEALATFERAAAAGGANADRLSNLAAASQRLARLDEAIAYADQAIALEPGDASAHWNRAVAHLLRGELARGWEDFESRWDAGVITVDTRTRSTAPLWEGQDVQGRALLLGVEQGLGDTIQFLRYVPELMAHGARVCVRVQPPLLGLARRSLPGATVLGPRDPAPPVDFHCQLMSVPRYLGIRVDNIPAAVPYLQADPAAVRRWQETLVAAAQGRLRVGLVWSGNAAHLNDRNRSIPLERLRGLAEVDALFVTVKPDATESERAGLAGWPRVLQAGAQLKDFSDTAAVIQALDVVVAVDTSVAHLAGALGKPLCVLLPWLPDWRWMLEREDSPWYPSARLYRQPQPRDWDAPLQRVREHLEQLARAKRGDGS